MSLPLPATYLDGRSLGPKPVQISLRDGTLRIEGLVAAQEWPVSEVRISSRLARLPRFIYLPDGATLEVPAGDETGLFPDILPPGRGQRLINWLEGRAWIAATATAILMLTVGAIVYFGLPWLARKGAEAVPSPIEQRAGTVALASLERMLGPSRLDAEKCSHVELLLKRLMEARHIRTHCRLEFRSSKSIGPNAFALPGGIIVLSDELVNLATDEEISAVIAHEMGHWQERHGLQSVLRGSAALLIVSTITGDLSTLTNFSAALPFILVQQGYSREFETEADEYALATMKLAGLAPAHFASVLDKLSKANPGTASLPSYLSTHPSTEERIRRIDPLGEFRKLPQRRQANASSPAQEPDNLTLDVEELGANPHLQPPRALSQPSPVYPMKLRALGIEGDVTLSFIVDKSGNVRAPLIVQSAHKDFEEPARQAVSLWKFKPGRKDGRVVNTRVQVTVTFRLTEEREDDVTEDKQP